MTKQDIFNILDSFSWKSPEVEEVLGDIYDQVDSLEKGEPDQHWSHDESTHKPFCPNCIRESDKETAFCPHCEVRLRRV